MPHPSPVACISRGRWEGGVEEKIYIYLLSRLLAHTMLREHLRASRRKFRTHGNGARDYYLFTAVNGARLVNHSEGAATAM